jgi:hypothetical protein
LGQEISFIIDSKVLANGIVLGTTESSAVEQFLPHFEVIFLDPSGLLNLMGRVSKDSLAEVHYFKSSNNIYLL